MAHTQTIKAIAKSWLRKGDQETNEFNRFISYWVAFNCFYNSWTGIEVDSQALESLGKNQTITQTYKSIINKSNMQLFQQLKAVCPIRKVSDPSVTRDISSFLNFHQVIFVLYQIRCNLVHGGKGEEIKRDKEVIKSSLPVLELVVKRLIKNHF